MTASAKPKPKKTRRSTKLHPHPVPLPASQYANARRTAARERRASGYSSLRVSKRTLELVKRLQEQAQQHANKKRAEGRGGQMFMYGYGRSWYDLGADELLYFDALQRLGELPADLEVDN